MRAWGARPLSRRTLVRGLFRRSVGSRRTASLGGKLKSRSRMRGLRFPIKAKPSSPLCDAPTTRTPFWWRRRSTQAARRSFRWSRIKTVIAKVDAFSALLKDKQVYFVNLLLESVLIVANFSNFVSVDLLSIVPFPSSFSIPVVNWINV